MLCTDFSGKGEAGGTGGSFRVVGENGAGAACCDAGKQENEQNEKFIKFQNQICESLLRNHLEKKRAKYYYIMKGHIWEEGIILRAVVTVMGIDKPGIIAKVSTCLSECGVNILDINQTIMQDIFTMVMLVDITDSKVDFTEISDRLEEVGKERRVQITFQHEDIFNSMHRI